MYSPGTLRLPFGTIIGRGGGFDSLQFRQQLLYQGDPLPGLRQLQTLGNLGPGGGGFGFLDGILSDMFVVIQGEDGDVLK